MSDILLVDMSKTLNFFIFDKTSKFSGSVLIDTKRNSVSFFSLVKIEISSTGFPSKFNTSKFVKFCNGEMFDILLFARYKRLNCFNLDKGLKSSNLVAYIRNSLSFVKLDNIEISVISG